MDVDRTIVELSRSYMELAAALAGLARAPNERSPNVDEELDRERVTGGYLDQMTEIAEMMICLRARSLEALRSKALVLKDWCDPRTPEIIDALAISLANDLAALPSG
ncbi:MAG TPA: hypothetical protein PK264_18880 [Hyphomicrobiaceae bacterium]|nr:hypothetical protein [Hyphomicrobiaceae bacterium]